VLALGANGWSSSALAFCRTTTCAACPRDDAYGCSVGGTPLAWPDACVSFSMNEAASAQVDLASATASMAEAFAIWQAARCGSDGAGPSIEIDHGFGPALCAEPEYNRMAGNANLVIFRDDSWPYTNENNQLASTSLTFDNDGVIFDADMEINATGPLSVPTAEIHELGIIPGQQDLLSIMVHEAGHFLGLDHSREENSVMQAQLDPGDVRTQLSADDVTAICTVYPPGRVVATCDPTPHQGFASQCGPRPVRSGCSVQPQISSRRNGARLTLPLSILFLWRLWRRRSAG
jgi:hypothetical protein